MDDILLSEEQLVSYDKVFLNIMFRNNITTVNQVLNVSENNLNYSHCALKNIQKIRGLIELLKYKYCNEDLLVSPILEKTISVNLNAELTNITDDEIHRLGFSDEDINYFRRFNFYLIRNGLIEQMPFINYLANYLNYDKKAKNRSNLAVERISDKIILYLQYMRKYEEFINIDKLKQNLQYLLNKRDGLNERLKQIQDNLDKINVEIANLQSMVEGGEKLL